MIKTKPGMDARIQEATVWIILIAFTIIGLRIPPTNLSHDFNLGRFPYSDGAGWIVGSVKAASGEKQRWVTRRPLNVPMNIASMRLAEPISKDPIVGSLAIKRTLAIASVAAMVLSLKRCWNFMSRIGIGIILLSSLFAGPLYRYSELINNSIGYTSGTELNGFILLTLGAAALVSTSKCKHPENQILLYVFLALGFLLLNLGIRMRPGSISLLPLMLLATLSISYLHARSSIHETRSKRFRHMASIFLVILITSGLTSFTEQIIFSKITDSCGAIGGNQGYTIYGISKGETWKVGKEFSISTFGQQRCERKINPILKAIGFKNIKDNPSQLLHVLRDNVIKRLSIAKRFLLQLPIMIGTGFLLLLCYLNRRNIFANVTDAPSIAPMIIGLAGWISIEFFVIIFLKEAYLRPITPYVVFPSLLIFGMINLITSQSSRFTAAFEKQHISITRFIYDRVKLICIDINNLILTTIILVLSLYAAGTYMLFHNAFKEDFGRVVGTLPINGKELVELVNKQQRLRENYHLYNIPYLNEAIVSSKLYCLKFSKDRIPKNYIIGKIEVSTKRCERRINAYTGELRAE